MFQSAFRALFTSCVVIFLFPCVLVCPAWTEVIELEFKRPAVTGTATDRTLESLVKVQGPGGVHLNGLYLMTHYGDREDLFLQENRSMIENPLIGKPWRYCSIFSSGDENHMIGVIKDH